ncbi:MAG: metal ABC transporter permease, partial [Phycisphaerales bacterium]|nr:metal ABC transporter permease [Phycisphaerales bacterium]
MSDAVHTFLSIDLLPLLAATLAAFSCGLLGNFLVLRRLSLMGDAISHAVLPGLVIAFLLFGTRASLAMFFGAAVAGVATVALVELIRRFGRVEPGAAMGVVFSVMFALGVVLLEQAAARQVDLDADCVLHGQLETIFWFPPSIWSDFLAWSTLRDTPRQVVVLAGTLAVCAAFVAVFFKELRLAAFDPGLADALGFRSSAIHAGLMALVAAATVASFEAVG